MIEIRKPGRIVGDLQSNRNILTVSFADRHLKSVEGRFVAYFCSLVGVNGCDWNITRPDAPLHEILGAFHRHVHDIHGLNSHAELQVAYRKSRK